MIKNRTIKEILGKIGDYNDKTREITIKLDALDPDQKVATGEGVVFALIKFLQETQPEIVPGSQEGARAMDVSKFTPFLSPRNGVVTQSTSCQLRFHSAAPLPDIEADQI